VIRERVRQGLRGWALKALGADLYAVPHLLPLCLAEVHRRGGGEQVRLAMPPG
jgi:hypothetical protein